MGADRYTSNPDSSICNHPNMSQYTDENGKIVAYCPSCGMQWS